MDENKKLIIVEDSPLFRAMMTNFLKRHYSFAIEEINSAREMESYLSSIALDDVLLVILDLYLPDGNGLEALKRFKKKAGVSSIPFIIVSARVSKEMATLAFKEGAKDVLAKPVNYEKLKERIDQIISADFKVHEKKSVMDYYKQIQLEQKRAKRGKYDLSILLVGIFQKADFKSVYKDSSYRQIIDLEEKYPAELQKAMRETDAIFSLSPSEYLFVLPFTEDSSISIIRKKITSVFEKLVNEEERKKLLMVIGAASFPGDGETTELLISAMEEDFKKQFSPDLEE